MPADELKRIIEERFNGVQERIDGGAIEEIVEVAECHPYYTQYLCHILYDIMEQRRIRAEDSPLAMDFLLQSEATAYMNTWDLLTQRQRHALIILSETAPGENPLRAEALKRFKMSRPAVMVRALKSLIDKDLVDKADGRYEIIEFFFKRWVRRYIPQSQPL